MTKLICELKAPKNLGSPCITGKIGYDDGVMDMYIIDAVINIPKGFFDTFLGDMYVIPLCDMPKYSMCCNGGSFRILGNLGSLFLPEHTMLHVDGILELSNYSANMNPVPWQLRELQSRYDPEFDINRLNVKPSKSIPLIYKEVGEMLSGEFDLVEVDLM